MSGDKSAVDAAPARFRSTLFVAAAIIAVCALIALGITLAAWPQSASGFGSPPAESSVDVGFARDMQMHHSQAVLMSTLVLDRTNDPAVRTLARDILLTQQQQAGQMYGWLEVWGRAQTSLQPPMSWMGNSGMASMSRSGGAMMPGMATVSQLQRLKDSSGRTSDRIYLQLMIPHHRGALAMAAYAADNAETAQVRRLAETIVQSQTAELTVLQRMLAERGGPVKNL